MPTALHTQNNPLNILSIGAGAIGTYIGGSLALHGHNLTFLEQPKVVQELRPRGLSLNINGIEHHATDINIVSQIDEALLLGPFDVALFALKSFHTQSAIEGMAAHADKLPPFLCLQNGVDNETELNKVLGPEKVIAASVTTAIGRRAAGDIVLERLRGIGIANTHTISEKLSEAFTRAGLNARLYPKADNMKWSKMLTNLISNASSAILDMTPAEVFAHPDIFSLEIAQLKECLTVMDTQGIKVIDLPGTPVRALAFGVRYMPHSILRPILAKKVGSGRGAKMPSFHIDLHAGSPNSEVYYLNGAVVRAGEMLGVPTPVNNLLNDTLLKLTNKDLPIEAYRRNPEKLLTALNMN